ncbi:MAG: FHA domain-containing protein [Anaerolineae bacterium]|nr:MAG: FHA domain-containing protein [Anaerolineae bacterium]
MMMASALLALRIALSTLLYLFLFTALWTLWREVHLQKQSLDIPRVPMLTLRTEDTIFRFSTPEVLIGRSPACDCCLNDNTVSAQHSQVVYKHGQWWVSDLNSTNGTFLNEQRLETPAVLRDGDQIRCGQVLLDATIEHLHP